ncbi:MAG: potassium channel family protein [Promethearchaeota archaeon]
MRWQEIEEKDKLLKIAESLFRTLKQKSEKMVDLAFSALLFGSKEIAEDVCEMEERMDNLHVMFEQTIITLASTVEEPKKLLSLLRLGIATENIADAAKDIAEVVLREIKPHPVFARIMSETDDTITRVEVGSGSPIVNRNIGDLRLKDETGMKIIAIRRDNDWLYRPYKGVKIKGGDILIAEGAQEGLELFERLVRGEEAEEESD